MPLFHGNGEQGNTIYDGMYLPVFYCLCYTKERSTGMLDKQLKLEREPSLEIQSTQGFAMIWKVLECYITGKY